jgi:hypothetical protein
MKVQITLFALIFSQFSIFSQEKNIDALRMNDIKSFTKKLTGNDALNNNINFDIAKTEIKYNFDISSKKMLNTKLKIDGKIASTNNYSVVFNNNEWLPDININLNFITFIRTMTSFYEEDIYNHKTQFKDAAQLFWLWLNFKGGYSYATYSTYNNDLTLLNEDKFIEERISGLNLSTNLHYYFYPSRKNFKWLTFIGKLGLEYKVNDNNYSSLKSIKIKEIKNVTDAIGNTIEVTSETKNIKEGKIITENSISYNFKLETLFTINEKFYIGFSSFGKKKVTKNLKSTDIGFDISVPIKFKKDSNNASIIAKIIYSIPDFNNDLNNLSLKEKGVFGFSIELPLK